ncbi:unnamed protein product [Brachionus calyciflorus]|uniref:EamA domain-containing protein n=1 Tax=Brachionus calyciflorus TaxID=104777 RepID=A0A814EQR5_9BILA|nr:unnamed protein product [Brachionus calyciflorus]
MIEILNLQNLEKKTSVQLNDSSNQDEKEEDSLLEFSEFNILSSSKASLRYKSQTKLNDKNISEKGTDKLLEEPNENALESNEKTFLTNLNEKLFLPYRGYYYGLISAFSFCLSQVLMKKSKWLAGSDHSTIRYFTTFIFMAIFMKFKKMELTGPKKKIKLLLFRGLLGSCYLISTYFAIMLIKPSDVTSLAHSGIIITAIMSRIFLKEKLTLAHILSIFLTAIGVMFISKPSFLFQVSAININNNISKNFTIEESNFEAYRLPLGISMTFLGSFFTSVAFLILKKLSNSKVHWAYSTICVTWFGFPLSILISIILIKLGIYHRDIDNEISELPMDIFYSFLASCLSLVTQIFLNKSFKYEDATKIAIIKTTDVFFSFLLQFLLLGINVDRLGIIGAMAILVGTFFVLVYKLMNSKYEEYKRNKQAIYLGNDGGGDVTKPTKKSFKRTLFKIIFFKF